MEFFSFLLQVQLHSLLKLCLLFCSTMGWQLSSGQLVLESTLEEISRFWYQTCDLTERLDTICDSNAANSLLSRDGTSSPASMKKHPSPSATDVVNSPAAIARRHPSSTAAVCRVLFGCIPLLGVVLSVDMICHHPFLRSSFPLVL